MAVTITNIQYHTSGDQLKRTATVALDSSYPNPAGYLISATQFAMTRFAQINTVGTAGYIIAPPDLSSQPETTHLFVYEGASGTTGATSAGTPAGTNGTSSVTAQTFTGTASTLNLASPTFSGTGLTAAGQVITTTSTHTMTLNQCAGMWLISATGATPPNLILSNTAVSGAAAVLTVQGAASTDAGAYKIVSVIPVGTNGTSTAAAQTFTGSALATHTHTIGVSAGGQVPNGTDLSAVSYEIVIYGY